MIPIGDSVRSRTFPFINLTIIALNVLVFLYELTLTTTPQLRGFSDLDQFIYNWGAIPACLVDWAGGHPDAPQRQLSFFCSQPSNVGLTPFASLFIHGGWLHLIGNMIFLWVFGDNVEDAMGHLRYAVFYVIVGLAATAAHIAVSQNDLTPAIGASGSIAGVLGAYIVLYPRATVTAILPLFLFFWLPFYIPAVFLIGLWFVLQVFSGIAGLASTDVVGAGGGVAWFAHIGGFVGGVALVRLFMLARPPPAPAAAPRRRR
ncbi:MAG: rhomboid family intramembrane serine protease [Dehalococcoidia bacterium]